MYWRKRWQMPMPGSTATQRALTTRGIPGVVYVKVEPNNYVEAVTTEYYNEKLLVNKQMVKTGIDEIPNLYGLIAAINKKESSSQYLADLQQIRKAYVQDVKGSRSKRKIPHSLSDVKNQIQAVLDKVHLTMQSIKTAQTALYFFAFYGKL